MIELRSVDAIRDSHSISHDISSLTASNVLGESDPRGEWEDRYAKMVEEAQVIDGIVEIMLAGPSDGKFASAVAEELRKDRYSSVKESMSFSKVPLTAYHAQQEKLLVDLLVNIASGEAEQGELEDIGEEGVQWLKAGWEVNPLLNDVSLDGVPTPFRFRDSFNHLARGLQAAEHEFYKQAMVPRIDMSLMSYNLKDVSDDWAWRAEGKTARVKSYGKRPVGLVDKKAFYEYDRKYGKLENVLDFVYYNRALDYLRECVQVKRLMNGSPFTRQYALVFADLKDIILRPNEEKEKKERV
jgi:hypothetical protein